MRRLQTASVLAAFSVLTGARGADDLSTQFLSPPESARPWTYWFVMDGNLSREGITADFEALKRVGIGGVLFMEVDVGIPKGPTKFMSPPWRELFKHANAEAARLGLRMTMPASPGWTGSGGPWVSPEQSMQKLVFSETNLVGVARFEGTLPQPSIVAGFYRDVAVLAFPTPTQSFHIEDLPEKALFQRGHFSSERGVKRLLLPSATYSTLPAEQVIRPGDIVDLTDKLEASGRLAWTVPQGNWTVLRVGHTSTGANTRPAPEPGLGLECDKLAKGPLEAHFNQFLGKLLADIGPLAGKSLVSLHIDSWEMGPQNWTAQFAEEFQRRRGYPLRRYLPVMAGRVVDSLEVSERFLWDLRQTVLELITENHAAYLAELAHQHGLGLSIEPYDGTPCDDMTYGSRADVPMGEFWRDTFQTWFSCTEASSIAHTYGQRIVQAEAFTSGDGERWLAHPATLKTLGDWAFCEGINRFVFHRYAHQPWLDRWPGMTMGPYGIHFDRTQTWFEQSKAWIEYLTRCQFLLQQGLFVADVCFLKPEASPQVFVPPASATRGSPPQRLGYSFDALTPEALLTRVSVANHRLELPDGMSYQVLVLPEVPTITPRLLRKIKELVNAGATVVGPRPEKSPSLSDYPACDEEVRQLGKELWGSCDGDTVREHAFGQGRLIWERSSAPVVASGQLEIQPELYGGFDRISSLLSRTGVPPDFASDAPLSSIHRRTATEEIYFIANREEHRMATECAFRVAGKLPEIWDPLTGRMGRAGTFRQQDGRTFLPLSLEPTGSAFVIFRTVEDASKLGAESEPLAAITRDGQDLLPLPGRPTQTPPAIEWYPSQQQLSTHSTWLVWEPGRYEFKTASGRSRVAEIKTLAPVRELTGSWEVHFQPNRGAPERLVFEDLLDWSKHPDPGVKYFSGTATYLKTFQVEVETIAPQKRLFLDLGAVQVMADVKLNGNSLGTLWKTPFRVDITDVVVPGQNALEIAVVNLWPNRLIGDQNAPAERRIAWTTWNPFTKDTPLLESGLLGPVTIRTAAVVMTP